MEERKKLFIKSLARFLAGNQVIKSIALQMGDPLAKEWADVRGHTPVFGYCSVEEAEQILTKFLT